MRKTRNNRKNKVNGKKQRKSELQNLGPDSKYMPTRLNSTECNVDYAMIHLLSMIAFYNVDSCTGINNTKPVEKLQNKYLRLLHQYLIFRYPKDAYVRLARGMDVISQAKESVAILQIIS